MEQIRIFKPSVINNISGICGLSFITGTVFTLTAAIGTSKGALAISIAAFAKTSPFFPLLMVTTFAIGLLLTITAVYFSYRVEIPIKLQTFNPSQLSFSIEESDKLRAPHYPSNTFLHRIDQYNHRKLNHKISANHHLFTFIESSIEEESIDAIIQSLQEKSKMYKSAQVVTETFTQIASPSRFALLEQCSYYKKKYAIDIFVTTLNQMNAAFLQAETLDIPAFGLIVEEHYDHDDTYRGHVTPIFFRKNSEKNWSAVVMDSVSQKNYQFSALKTLSSLQDLFFASQARQFDQYSCRTDALALLRNALLSEKLERNRLEDLPLSWKYTFQTSKDPTIFENTPVIRDLFSKKINKQRSPRYIADLLQENHIKDVMHEVTYYSNTNSYKYIKCYETYLTNTYLVSKGKNLEEKFEYRAYENPMTLDAIMSHFIG